MKPNPLEVVAAVIRNSEGRILLAQKRATSSQPLHWEFPGGKVEENETQSEALAREIKEELGLDIEVNSFFAKAEGEIKGREIHLYTYDCKPLTDQPILHEHNAIQWLFPAEMTDLLAGPLDTQIMEILKQF